MSRVVREWTLVREIGRGGMGVVWLARHQYMAGDWAVKVMRPELMDDQESRERFLSEAMVLSTLHHPGIVGIQSPFIDDGQLFMPMEYLTGVSLDTALKSTPGPWDADRSVQIIAQVADAVGYAHRRNPPVVHRDLKPLNIQLTDEGIAKVLDFGLARALGDKSMTATGKAVGTPAYMSPEVLEGARALGDKSMTATGKAVGTPAYMSPEVLEGARATPRSDVYSLGVILFRMLAGRLPYDLPDTESSLHAIFMAVIRGIDRGLPDVREFVPGIVPQLGGLTMRMLSRDPGDRPADGGDLAQMLAAIQSVGRPVESGGVRPVSASDDVTRIGIDVARIRSEASRPTSPSPKSAGQSPAKQPPTKSHVVDADRSLIGIRVDGSGQSGTTSSSSFPSSELHPDPVVKQHRDVSNILGNDDLEAWRRDTREASAGKKWWIIGAAAAVIVVVVGFVMLSRLNQGGGNAASVSTVENSVSDSVTVAAPVPADQKSSGKDQFGIEWVRLPGGTFQMGSNSGDNDEEPVHSVTLSAFELAATEVTVAQHRQCVQAGACSAPHSDDGTCWVYNNNNLEQGVLPQSFRGDNQPVVCVDWDQATAYAKWVSGRLPTEAEWEYAARSGGRNQEYPWGNQTATCSYAIMDDGGKGCGRNSTWPVCSKPAGNTSQGLCDMSGNVWEWVSDWYGSYGGGSLTNPTGPSSGSSRVDRGGSWNLGAWFVRVAGRDFIDPGYRSATLGFRVARSVP